MVSDDLWLIQDSYQRCLAELVGKMKHFCYRSEVFFQKVFGGLELGERVFFFFFFSFSTQ